MDFISTYRKLDEGQHCQSSSIPRYHPYQGRPSQREPQLFAKAAHQCLHQLAVSGYTYANDALLPDKLDQLILHCAGRVSLAVSLEVAEITDMALVIGWGAVRLVVWVVWG